MPETTSFHGVITRETKAAVLFDAITFKDWFPKSEINIQEISHMRSVPRQVEITIPNWILKKKGIEDAI